MNRVKCVKCLQKHLALAKSYAREVLDGHGEGGVPDHREDMDGEIANAEMHASVIDQTMQLKIRNVRRTMQRRRFNPTADDLESLSTLYHYSDVFDGLEVTDEVKAAYDALDATDILSNVTSVSVKKGCGCHNDQQEEESK